MRGMDGRVREVASTLGDNPITMNNDLFSLMVMTIAIPVVALLIGVIAAVRVRRSHWAAVVVVLSLAVSAAVSIRSIPMEQTKLRIGNPYPIGIGGVMVEYGPPGPPLDAYR